jgi:hypothetical protein
MKIGPVVLSDILISEKRLKELKLLKMIYLPEVKAIFRGEIQLVLEELAFAED